MTLGGVLIYNGDKDNLSSKLNLIKKTMGVKKIHCKELNHRKKVFFARSIAKERILCFGLISLKETLLGYKSNISEDSSKYYNKCAIYLLENLGRFMKENNISPEKVQIIFEDGNYNYDALKNFIRTCQRKQFHENAKLLKYIDVDQICSVAKSGDPLLQIADLTAHSLFKCVDKIDSNFHIPETKYLEELRKRFYCDPKTKSILGNGIKAIHDIKQLNLDEDIASFIESLKA